MPTYKFSVAGVNEWDRAARTVSLKVAKLAAKELSRRIILDTPVDTGFLVASSVPILNRSESPPELDRPVGFFQRATARGSKVAQIYATIARMRSRDRFSLFFIAKYAKWVHQGDGNNNSGPRPFVERHVRVWPSIVASIVNTKRNRA